MDDSLGRLGFVTLAGVVCAFAIVLATRHPEPAAVPVASVASVAPVTSVSLPAGHPPLPPSAGWSSSASVGAAHAGKGGPMPPRVGPSLDWVAPARWQLRPHISAMRIATYEIPHAPGDAEDAELSITRAGGDLQVNADRWIAQFDAPAKATAKKTERTLAGVRALFVEVRGAYQGLDMAEPEPGFMLLGAIVDTPHGAHFFKLTGPAKSVEAARAELEALLASLKPRAVPDGG